MARTNLAAKFPPSQKENIPEKDVPAQEPTFEEVELLCAGVGAEKEIRMRVPGTVFEVNQWGQVKIPAELLKLLLDNYKSS